VGPFKFAFDLSGSENEVGSFNRTKRDGFLSTPDGSISTQ